MAVGVSLEISQAQLGGGAGPEAARLGSVAELRLPHVPVTSWATSEDAEERALSQCHAVTQGGLQQGGHILKGGSPWRSRPHRGAGGRLWPLATSDPCTHPPPSLGLSLLNLNLQSQGQVWCTVCWKRN